MPIRPRRTLLAACAALALVVGAPLAEAVAADAPTVLRMVPQADLKILDPMFTTNYVTRNYGYLVYDTLFGQDRHGVPKPQMVERYTRSDDGLVWSFTLRDGLKFHDGTAVTASDCVASLERWSARDNYGRAMVAAGAKWRIDGERSFTLTLERPFGLVLEGLSKVSGMIPVILPERVARASADRPITEAIGSGPYVFVGEEWVPGSKVVFRRNPDYVGRAEPPDFLSGDRAGHVDRIEWVYLPDANSATAALRRGEVDMLELVPPDYIAPLRADPAVKVMRGGAYQGNMILNQTQPPFDDPRVRRVVLKAIDQDEVTAAMGYPADLRLKHCDTFFICGGPFDTAVGSEPYRTPDVAAAKKMLAETGYAGKPLVVLLPTDFASLNGAALMVIQTLRKVGFQVNEQPMDWATLVARRAKKDPVEQGGWNFYVTHAAGFDANSPINNFMLGAACGNSMPGWPCDAKLDELRRSWVAAVTPEERKARLDAFQARAFEVVPYAPVGQFWAAYAVRADVGHTERLWGDVPLLWTLEKQPAK